MRICCGCAARGLTRFWLERVSCCPRIRAQLSGSFWAPRRFKDEPSMVRVKICGITNEDDARSACEAGADLVGFNFYKGSPRYVKAAEAEKIRPQLPANVEAVGVFVNAERAEVA